MPLADNMMMGGSIILMPRTDGSPADNNTGIGIMNNHEKIRVCATEKWPCFLFSQWTSSFISPMTKNMLNSQEIRFPLFQFSPRIGDPRLIEPGLKSTNNNLSASHLKFLYIWLNGAVPANTELSADRIKPA